MLVEVEQIIVEIVVVISKVIGTRVPVQHLDDVGQ